MSASRRRRFVVAEDELSAGRRAYSPGDQEASLPRWRQAPLNPAYGSRKSQRKGLGAVAEDYRQPVARHANSVSPRRVPSGGRPAPSMVNVPPDCFFRATGTIPTPTVSNVPLELSRPSLGR